MSYWHDFTHPVITEAGDNDEATDVAEDFLGIPSEAQDVADKFDTPRRKRGPIKVTPDSTARTSSMPRLSRRRYGGTRSRRQPYMHGASHRAGSYNPVHYRGRRRGRGRRRKLRWGTKVRKQALGLFEGKRLVKANTTVDSQAQNTIWKLAPFVDFVNDDNTATEIGDIKTSRFNGRGVHVRGIKVNLWCFNKTLTHPCIVRVICGWRKIYADVGTTGIGINTEAIFLNTDTKEKARLLSETADVERGVTWRTTKAPIDKSAFKVEKDMTFQLGPSDKTDEQNHGNALKQVSFWWEMNNRILRARTSIDVTDSSDTRLKKLGFNPVIMVYHCNHEIGETVTTPVDYRYDYAIYWKDPLG